jgi:hypothetical protein
MNETARDEAVQRIREESARRIARTGRRAVASRCALGALLSLAAFAALESGRGAPPPAVVTAVAPAQPDPAVVRERDHREMCAKLLVASRELRLQLGARLGAAHGKKQHARIWAEIEARHAPLVRAEAEEGCPVIALTPEQRPRWQPKHGCGCMPCGHSF